MIELAGDAVNGVHAHVGLTPDALVPGIRAFDNQFLREHRYRSDHNGMKGYVAAYVLKAVTEKIGKFDSQRPRDAMKGDRPVGEGPPGNPARRAVRRQGRPRPGELHREGEPGPA